MKVVILPYDPAWASEFEKHKVELLRTLEGVPISSIEHVGSTSVPGLKAKPVLDIDIIIPPSSLEATRQALSQAGYFDCGECGVPGRWQFRQPGYGRADAAFGHSEGEMRRNTYAMIEGFLALRNHLDVKSVLIEDEALREEYGRVKTEISDRDFSNIAEYGKAKSGILQKILRKAGWTDAELEAVFKTNN